jgi:tRNA threonylcarbamoyladenosine biosynthesis protein TsaE
MELTITSEEDMKRFGERIGRLLRGGECIELIGDIGSGKTTLTKGIAVGLGIIETVQSPTFTINRVYDGASGIRLSHYDFYRLNDAGIMAEELAESLAEPRTSIVIEWGDIVSKVLPSDCLSIAFTSPTEASRVVTLTAGGPVSAAVLESLA